MIEDMYAVMQRINEIRSRFGLGRRQHPQQLQGLEQQINPAQQVREIDAAWPEGNAEVQQAINYLVGQGGQTPQTGLPTQNPLVGGLGNLIGGGNQGGQNFFQTLLETIRSDENSENE